jgi:hypothetical protein
MGQLDRLHKEPCLGRISKTNINKKRASYHETSASLFGLEVCSKDLKVLLHLQHFHSPESLKGRDHKKTLVFMGR